MTTTEGIRWEPLRFPTRRLIRSAATPTRVGESPRAEWFENDLDRLDRANQCQYLKDYRGRVRAFMPPLGENGACLRYPDSRLDDEWLLPYSRVCSFGRLDDNGTYHPVVNPPAIDRILNNTWKDQK